MALKDMALTAEEAKSSDYGCCVSEGEEDKGPKYPYGLELSLRSEAMKKLGMGLMPVGTEVIVMAKATVTGTSSRQRQGGEAFEDMDVQITALDLTPVQADRMAKAASRMYPDGGEGDI
jgi:hypothetical protein